MIILSDTREKNEWDFSWYDCEVVKKKLSYGDYSVKGLEHIVRIERKASTAEICNNLCTKNGLIRFEKELGLLKENVKNPYIICEFPSVYLNTFPENSGIPKTRKVKGKVVSNKPKVSAKFLRKKVYEIQDTFNINIIYCESRTSAESVAYKILKEAYDENRDNL